MRVALRPATRADLPLVASWLAQPHVTQWWGTPVDVDARYGPRIDGSEAMDVLMVEPAGRPVGLVQRQLLALSPDDRDRLGALLPDLDLEAAADVDYLVGEPTALRSGVAAAALAELARATRRDDPAVERLIAVVERDNLASMRTAARAGFVPAWSGTVSSDVAGHSDEDVVVHVLELREETL